MVKDDSAVPSDMLSNEQRPHAVSGSLSLEELLAERIAAEAARIAEERVREIVWLSELDPDEGAEEK